MREIDLVYRAIVAELGQRCMNAQFVRNFRTEKVDGSFVKIRVKDREYWYY